MSAAAAGLAIVAASESATAAQINVFLEIGYAWAKDKPTVLMVKKGQKLPFDITGQKCIVYSTIFELRSRLKTELKALVNDGTLVARAGS